MVRDPRTDAKFWKRFRVAVLVTALTVFLAVQPVPLVLKLSAAVFSLICIGWSWALAPPRRPRYAESFFFESGRFDVRRWRDEPCAFCGNNGRRRWLPFRWEPQVLVRGIGGVEICASCVLAADSESSRTANAMQACDFCGEQSAEAALRSADGSAQLCRSCCLEIARALRHPIVPAC